MAAELRRDRVLQAALLLLVRLLAATAYRAATAETSCADLYAAAPTRADSLAVALRWQACAGELPTNQEQGDG